MERGTNGIDLRAPTDGASSKTTIGSDGSTVEDRNVAYEI